MEPVLTAQEMRELDAATIAEVGLPGVVLMENAGRAVADCVICRLDMASIAINGARVAIVCGAGNNGGDGYVVGRWLRGRNVAATVYLAADRGAIRGDAATHLDVFEQTGGVAHSVTDLKAVARQRDAIGSADVIVDCLFGTGLDRVVVGHMAELIAAMNQRAGDCVAADIPSGVAADSGAVLGRAVRADVTVTMGFLKVAHAVAPGFARCGVVEIAAIGIPRQLAQAHGVRLGLLEREDVIGSVPELDSLAFKNRRGHALIIAGSPGKRGAGRLTAAAALRLGAGLVTLSSPGTELRAEDPIMTASLQATGDTSDVLARLVAGKAVVAIGPGMQTDARGAEFVAEALATVSAPLVLDADALNHIGADLASVAGARGPVVLTPHPGEAARLLGCSVGDVERDRIAAVRRLAELARAVVVLKGARTLVCDGIAGDGFVTVNPTGNAGLATAGSGDVLTGAIAALLAQGTTPAAAARLAVWIHGSAADGLVPTLGHHGITATDVCGYLPVALRELVAGQAA